MSAPTPEQARQLVEHFGGQRAAAAAVGVHRATVWTWVNPEKRVSHNSAHYRVNRERLKAKARARYHRLKDEGQCVRCAARLTITETLCWDCADKHKEASAWRR